VGDETLEQVTLTELTDAKLRELAERGDASLFCSHDHGAMQLWHHMRRLGIRAPEDVRLVGFDGDEYGELVGLTTAVFDSEALAETAFTHLVALLSGQAQNVAESVPVTVRVGTTS
jgi:DNA-binding LacI/PurR family transcriptional regulator